ncbi:hypothetical protein PATSB16_01250 [Pandoraea thiooxydans]|nr:hypothetical protein PATSB16_01250 [Pandoraea thiooxydans]
MLPARHTARRPLEIALDTPIMHAALTGFLPGKVRYFNALEPFSVI